MRKGKRCHILTLYRVREKFPMNSARGLRDLHRFLRKIVRDLKCKLEVAIGPT